MYLNEIRKHISDGWGGRLLASYLTSVIDKMISTSFPSVQEEATFAVFATGSYGREELCPFSDIDIMLFAPYRDRGNAATQFLYRLWDSGLNISHAFRTPDECIEEAFSDMKTRTALLEARLVCGNEDLLSLYKGEVLQKIRGNKKKEYVSAKLREIHERHGKGGNSPFLLQPDVKESRGGLRDIHGALWLTSILFKYDNIDCFREILMEDDFKKLLRAYDYMLRLRFVIHILSMRKNDKLLFELQDETARMLGVRGSKKFTSVERLMRYYFIKAKTISLYTERIFNICGQAVTRKRINLSVKKLTEPFWLSKDRIILKRENCFKENPLKIMEAFHIYATSMYKMSEHLIDSIKRDSLHIRQRHRTNKNMIELFLSILLSQRVYETLRIMHETGVLDRFLPEFGSLRYLLVNDYYHAYPVDEHSLVSIKKLETLNTTKDESNSFLSEIMRKFKKRDILYFSLLLHDIGKSKGRYHEKESYRAIKNITNRVMLEKESRELLEYLVKNHLLMSDVAFKHDIESPEVVASFSEKVMTEEKLSALYLLTYADMASVSDTFWTPWRASLLHNLYIKTRDHIHGIRINREDFLNALFEKFSVIHGLNNFIEVVSEDYLLTTPPEKIAIECDSYNKALSDGFTAYIDDKNDGTTEISIAVKDRRGIFADILSVFAVRRLNIIEARLFTTKDGIAVDRIRVSNWNQLWWEGMDGLIKKELESVLIKGNKVIIEEHFKGKRNIESFIEFDNEGSGDYTIVEFMAPDRLGLLYDTAKAFCDLGVNIISGRIYTEQNIANDIFYINAEGEQVGAEQLYTLMDVLWQEIKD